MAKKIFNVWLDEDVIARLHELAEADHLSDGNKLAAFVVSKFSDLKPGCVPDALASIPKHLFRARRGRPAATAGDPENRTETPLQSVS